MCVLRVSGAEFDVDAFLEGSSLPTSSVYRRGELRHAVTRPDGPVYEASGVNIPVSEASWFDLPAQVQDAENSLRDHRAQIVRLSQFPGVEELTLDFPLYLRIGSGVLAQFDRFCASLVQAAGSLALALEISIYPPPSDEKSVA